MKKFLLTQGDCTLLNFENNQIFDNKNLKDFATISCEDLESKVGGAIRTFSDRCFFRKIRR